VRLLVPLDEADHGGRRHQAVGHQYAASEQHRLARDGEQYRDVHGVADEAVRTADHQPIGLRHRRRGARTLDHEPYERRHDDQEPEEDKQGAEEAYRPG
jgi:hypothetical protein